MKSYVKCVKCKRKIKQGKSFIPVVGSVSGGLKKGNILVAKHNSCLLARLF